MIFIMLGRVLIILVVLLGSLSWGVPRGWTSAGEGSVGILIDYDPPGSGTIVVYSVRYKSPADKAKVRRGERLLKVDGKEVTGMALADIAGLIRGPVGTTVTLSLSSRQGTLKEVALPRVQLPEGPVVSVPPPSQMGTGLYLTNKEKALVKQKILGLDTDAKRARMWNLLKALKEGKLSKPKFMRALKTEFP